MSLVDAREIINKMDYSYASGKPVYYHETIEFLSQNRDLVKDEDRKNYEESIIVAATPDFLDFKDGLTEPAFDTLSEVRSTIEEVRTQSISEQSEVEEIPEIEVRGGEIIADNEEIVDDIIIPSIDQLPQQDEDDIMIPSAEELSKDTAEITLEQLYDYLNNKETEEFNETDEMTQGRGR